MRRKKILILGACCLLAAGAFTGCGNKKADDTKAVKTESTEKKETKKEEKKEELKTIGRR